MAENEPGKNGRRAPVLWHLQVVGFHQQPMPDEAKKKDEDKS